MEREEKFDYEIFNPAFTFLFSAVSAFCPSPCHLKNAVVDFGKQTFSTHMRMT